MMRILGRVSTFLKSYGLGGSSLLGVVVLLEDGEGIENKHTQRHMERHQIKVHL